LRVPLKRALYELIIDESKLKEIMPELEEISLGKKTLKKRITLKIQNLIIKFFIQTINSSFY
jgi:hypothetical protein